MTRKQGLPGLRSSAHKKPTVGMLLLIFNFVVLPQSIASAGDDASASKDTRNIVHGLEIPSERYADQPYLALNRDGSWLCVLTTGRGREGEKGQHIVATISPDRGRTWSELIDIEPANGPAASWAMPLVTPSGRVYVFYNYNGDHIADVARVDTLGWYCYRYSDDGGRTWSERQRLPVRQTAVDRQNHWNGKVQMFWGIGKPILVKDAAIFSFTKIGKYPLDNSEGWFFRSDNILTEQDPQKIHWQMLPEGEHGLRAPEHGSIQSEQNLVALSNGDLYCMYRTAQGYPCHSYSRDGGKTWTKPVAATYTPGGRRFKHPRACPRIWRTNNGHFLFWFHNNGGKSFQGRNPAWLSGGVEIDGKIHWSQPEIFLYAHDPAVRMSYPDLIEQDGRYWISETQKTIARIHQVDPGLLHGMWNQRCHQTVARDGLILELGPQQLATKKTVAMPRLPDLGTGGFTLELWFRVDSFEAGQVLLDAQDNSGHGVRLVTEAPHSLKLRAVSKEGASLEFPFDPEILRKGHRPHHLVLILDGAANMATAVVDGRLCDGGKVRTQGWKWFDARLDDLNGDSTLRLAPSWDGQLLTLRLYDRYFRTSEAVGNFRAGIPHDLP